MARQESEREDLLREATALVERVEFTIPAVDEPIVVGFRRDGSASVFVGAGLVFQFNRDNQLRRGFDDGQLLKATQGRLVSMRRERTDTEVRLISTELSDVAQSKFLDRARDILVRIRQSIAAECVVVVGQVPDEGDVLGRIADWTATLNDIDVATQPGLSR